MIVFLECAYDHNIIKLKIRAKQENHLPDLMNDMVILVKEAERRISKQIEIYIQLEYKMVKDHIMILGRID